MKTQLERLPNSRVKLKIELSEDEFAQYYQRVFLRLSSQTDVKGFRPGKAPEDLIRNKIGEDKIFQEALEMCLPATFFEAVKKEKLQPVADPDIKVEKYNNDQPLVYTAEIDILPDFKLPDYRKFKIQNSKIKISEKEVQDSMKGLQKAYATYEDKKEPAEKGDKVEIDFAGSIKGAKIEQLTSKNHPLILGEGGFVPGFEEKLVGLKAGQNKEFDYTMPDKLRDQFLVGKKVKFKVKMLKVQKVVLPKLDDEFAQKIAKGKKLAQVKKEVGESLQKRAELEEKKKAEAELLNKLAEKTEMEIPRSLVKNQQYKMMTDIQKDIESRGIPLAKYLESIGKTEDELNREMATQAGKSVKIGLIIGKIKEAEKITASKAEIDKELAMAKRSGYPIEDEELVKKRIKISLENQKTVEKLIDIASK